MAAGLGNPPGVLLLDCDGGEPGRWRTDVRALGSAQLGSQIVMLCRELREEVVRSAIEHRLGGVILKSYSITEVQAAIAYIATGRSVLPAGWQGLIASPVRRSLGLSPRHRQILALIAEGRSNEEIAGQLELSPNTIKFHIRALYSRLGVRNRVEAANRHAQLCSDDA